MKTWRNLSAFAGLLALATTAIVISQDRKSGVNVALRVSRLGPEAGSVQVVNFYGKLPLIFEPNYGQAPPNVRFLSRGNGYTLQLTATQAVLSLRAPGRGIPVRGRRGIRQEQSGTVVGNSRTTVLRMKLANANPTAKLLGLESLPSKSNYIIGNDPRKWRTNIPHYGKVRYEDVYPGVDLVYYGNNGRLEYDFVIEPGADPSLIRLRVEGAEKLNLDSGGDLVLQTPEGQIVQRSPFIYQSINGTRKGIRGRYVLRGSNEVGFDVEAYDKTKPLIIDPVLVFSTFLGPGIPIAVAVDTAGNAYIWGNTGLTEPPFPTTPGAFQTVFGGLCGTGDTFISKISSDGSSLVYSTYLGGNRDDYTGDYGNGIAVDGFGNVFVTGYTSSIDFPTTTGAFQTSPNFQAFPGGCSTNGRDAFVTKLDPAGAALVYSTFLGGTADEQARGIAVDSDGNAFVTGFTTSTDFPTSNAIQGTLSNPSSGETDAFVTKLNPSGSSLVYSTYLGGLRKDEGTAIAVDVGGNAFVTGETGSEDFPTSFGAFDRTRGFDDADAFVTKISPAGVLVYSTYLGGDYVEIGNGIAVDGEGNAFVTGPTYSADFPATVGAFDTGCGTDGQCNLDPTYGYVWPDAFVSKLSPDGSELVYSTFIGGSDGEIAYGIALDASGKAYVVGSTLSGDFPTVNAFQPEIASPYGGDGFLAQLASDASQLLYSTYLGGISLSGDNAQGVGLNSLGHVYVVCQLYSTEFPTINGLAVHPNPVPAFILKLDFSSSGPAATNMTVHPQIGDSADLGTTLTFTTVTQFGRTTLNQSSSGPPPPLGFSLGDPPLYYDLTTAVVFSGAVTVCFNYSGISFTGEASLRLFHFEGDIWVDRTVSLDTSNDIICASVTSLSPFAVFEHAVQPLGLQPPLAALVPESDTAPLPDRAFKRGSTLPLKLQLFRGGVLLSDADVSAPQIVALFREGEAVNLETVDLGTGQASDMDLVFRYSDGNWVYNLSSKNLSTGTYTITIQMPGEKRYAASFVLR